MKSKAVAFVLTAGAVIVAFWAMNNIGFVQKFIANSSPKPLG